MTFLCRHREEIEPHAKVDGNAWQVAHSSEERGAPTNTPDRC